MTRDRDDSAAPNTDAAVAAREELLLSVRGLSKEFPGLRALDEVSIDVHSGEIVAVLGHNGSGKSTLVKVLAGIYTADGGTVRLGRDDGATDIHFIHQDLGLIQELNAVENLELVRTSGSRALLPTRSSSEMGTTEQRLGRFGSSFDIAAPVRSLSAAQRAIIAIARALDGWTHDRHVLVLDEPTEALHKSEVQILFSAVREVAQRGAGVIFISHRLDEVLELADRIVVLRDGKKVFDAARESLDEEQLVELVAGVAPSAAPTQPNARTSEKKEPVLEVRGLRGEVLKGVDLEASPGEIVGIAGVLGSGREEVPAVLFGAKEGQVDSLMLGGRPRQLTSPGTSIRDGIAFVPGDRARWGAVLPMSAKENLTLPWLRPLRRGLGGLDKRREAREVDSLMGRFGVRPGRPDQELRLFSGGNQQKIVLSKWLRTDPAVLLLEEPTQGVDVGAKAAIYEAVSAAAESGTAVVVCSSDAKELALLCSRVYVLRDGLVAAELSGPALTESALVREGYGVGARTEPARSNSDQLHLNHLPTGETNV